MADERSWLESLKHYVSAPRRAFEGMARPPNDPNSPIEYATASPLVNISRQDIDNATEAAMAVSGGGLSTKPIRTYHSSPHDFERFDLSKMGTGEGAQVYGPGMYLAENPAVSGQGGEYWKKFLRRFKDTPEGEAAGKLWTSNFDREAAAKATLEARNRYATQPSRYLETEAVNARRDELQKQYELLKSGKPVGPRTYEVDIHAKPEDLLHWDKPLEKQNVWERMDRNVRDSIDEAFEERGVNAMSDVLEDYTGRDLYRALKHHDVHEALPAELPGSSWYTGATNEAKHTAAYLDSLGIPGVKYLDQASRLGVQTPTVAQTNTAFGNVPMLGSTPVPTPTHNYAIWRDSILDIVKKYGLAGIAGAPPLAGGLRDKDKQ